MSAIHRFSCPACAAKMKALRLPTVAVNCPKCGKAFVPRPAVDSALEEDTYGLHEPPEAPVAPTPMHAPRPTPSSSSGETPKKKKKRKKGAAGLDPETKKLFAWLGAGAAALLIALGVWLGIARSRKPLTLDGVAGNYVCDKNSGYQIHLTADGRCGLTDEANGGSFTFGYPFTIDGATLVVGIDKEFDSPLIEVEKRKIAGINIVKLQLKKFGDLSYAGDAIDSSELGRFSRVKDAGTPAAAVAGQAGGQGQATEGSGTATPVGVATLEPDNHIVVSDDGSTAVTMNGKGIVATWDVATKKALGAWDTRFALRSVALSPDGKWLALGGVGAIRLMDAHTGAYVTEAVQNANVSYERLTFTPDSRHLFATNMQFGYVLDSQTGVLNARFEVYPGKQRFREGIQSFVLTNDGRTCIALTINNGPIMMKGIVPTFLEWWSLETGSKERTLELPGSTLEFGALALSQDGSKLALVVAPKSQSVKLVNQQSIEVRDARNGAFLDEYRVASSTGELHVMFNQDNQSLVVCGDPSSGTVRPAEISEWEIANGLRTRFVDRNKGWSFFRFAPRPHLVICADTDPPNPHDAGTRWQVRVVDVAKLPWKDDPGLAENRRRIATVKRSFDEQDTERVNSLGMKLVALPKGEMESGSPVQETRGVETPRFFVRIHRPLMMDRCPVTVGAFAAFVKEASYSTDAEKTNEPATWKSPGFAQTDSHPVVCVSQRDAIAFCVWLSQKEGRHYRLPTEGEWEYACRAGTKTSYFFGAGEHDLKDYAWIAENSDKHTHPVGEKKPNPWGLLDVLGNAQQLCADSFSGETTLVAVRGGSWASKPQECQAISRTQSVVSLSNPRTGFRVVLDSQ